MPDEIIDGLLFEKIDPMAAVSAVNATLRRIDARLIDHGERVAFIACEYCEWAQLPLDMKTLFLLCVFHDIGAYKTEEIDRMVEFETSRVNNHAVYGYLFLKYMTPLRQYAEAVLYHHTPWRVLSGKDPFCRDYAALIHLADRIDIALHYDAGDRYLQKLFHGEDTDFPEEMLSRMEECLRERAIAKRLDDGSYRDRNLARCGGFLPSAAETLEYLKMIVYSIDFRSEFTVTHTVNTVSVALDISKHFGLSGEEQEKIYLGSLLHDVGKIAISVTILEKPGKLDDAEMKIMRTHVDETEAMIRGIVPEDICEIAVRHHEKLDGSGYPRGLRGEELTFPQRIVAVADIISALSNRRSYKEPFPEEKSLSILRQMSDSQLDRRICDYICASYDEIMERTDGSRQQIIRQYRSIMNEYHAACEAVSRD